MLELTPGMQSAVRPGIGVGADPAGRDPRRGGKVLAGSRTAGHVRETLAA
jgi:hypothetical protein